MSESSNMKTRPVDHDPFIEAWHGSPHDFDQFQNQAIGSGEGAQVYGHGHYVAENRKIAEWYRDQLSKRHAPPQTGKVQVHLGSLPIENTIDSWLEKLNRVDNAEYIIEHYSDPSRKTHYKTGKPISKDQIWSLKNSATKTLPLAVKQLENQAQFIQSTYGVDPHSPAWSGLVKVFTNGRVFSDDFQYAHNALSDSARDSNNSVLLAEMQAAEPFLSQLHRPVPAEFPGRLYQLAIKADPNKMLDWDSSLLDHHDDAADAIERWWQNAPTMSYQMDAQGNKIQPQKQRALVSLGSNTGEEIYRSAIARYGSAPAATKSLLDAGIHGIKYRDANSRGGGQAKPELYFDGKPIEAAIKAAQIDWEDKYNRGVHIIDHDFQHLTNVQSSYDDMHHSRPSINLLRSSIGNNETAGWFEDNHHRFNLQGPKPSYNYVIFDPNMIEHVKKYDIKGNLIKDYGSGVHVKPVNHDPFKE